MFRRLRHQHIATILESLDSDLLSEHECFFGGGTAIAMSRGEFRQSDDVDFLVSNGVQYRELRHLVTGSGPGVLFRDKSKIQLPRTFTADQYGIRGWVEIFESQIKFEIVSEGRIAFSSSTPPSQICGVDTLSEVDLATEKIMANSDRFIDTSTFQRDIIDLAFLEIPNFRTSEAFQKGMAAYGERGVKDLDRSLEKLLTDGRWLDTCLTALQISPPKALVIKLLEQLR